MKSVSGGVGVVLGVEIVRVTALDRHLLRAIYMEDKIASFQRHKFWKSRKELKKDRFCT